MDPLLREGIEPTQLWNVCSTMYHDNTLFAHVLDIYIIQKTTHIKNETKYLKRQSIETYTSILSKENIQKQQKT